MTAKDIEAGTYEIPRLIPKPAWCANHTGPVRCLDGIWDIEDYKDHSVRHVSVPSDMTILQRAGWSKHYEYRKEIVFTKEESAGRVVLKFEGVNGFATVYIDGTAVASHKNGFLTWNVDITTQVRGKQKVLLRVVLDEQSDQISAYNHGGILHSVYLYFLPEQYVNALYLTPLFGEDMERCTLRVDMDLAEAYKAHAGEMSTGKTDMEAHACKTHIEGHADDGQTAGRCPAYAIGLTLYRPKGVETISERISEDAAAASPAGTKDQTVSKDEALRLYAPLGERIDGYYTFQLPVADPVLWDAEHPNLYLARISLYADGVEVERVTKQVGLRKLTRAGNRLFVNGREVKLHGSCRHETSALRGRATTKEMIETDVALFKEANCNYIRTSHYPPSEYFLDLCDARGIYVEDELALAFIARSLPYTQRDPAETARYISHFTECLARDYNHASVIIWSLCNESFGGYNFDILNRFVHKKDPTRVTKFSYPMTIREEHEMPDIWSIHYSEYDTDLAKKRDNVSVGYAPGRDMPVLHDEYVHVPCYNREELRRDPAVRTFWGEGLKLFWDKIWNTEGALGGAIWAGLDETDIYTGGSTQLAWGIIDAWRRKKPEFYMVRKAYSPIHVIHYELQTDRCRMLLVAENRFCHTDFSEVTLHYHTRKISGSCRLPSAAPRCAAKILVPLPQKVRGPVFLRFIDAFGNCVDEMQLTAAGEEAPLLVGAKQEAGMSGDEVCIQREQTRTVLTAGGTVLHFSAASGLLTGLYYKDKRYLIGGPYLNVPYLKLGDWKLASFDAVETGGAAEVTIDGSYEGTLALIWKMRLYPDGTFTTSYRITRMDAHLPKQLKLRVGVDAGGLDERGIAFICDPAMDTFAWNRCVDPDSEVDYTWYPPDHIARNRGIARRFSEDNTWGRQPDTVWSLDMKDDLLCGRYDVDYKGTNDLRSTKERVREGYLYAGADHAAIAIDGNDTGINIRLEVVDPAEEKITERDPRIRYSGTWYRVRDRKGSDHGTEMWSHEKGAEAVCRFTGTGIVWYGPEDTTYGMADVYIDGKLAAHDISQRVAGSDFSCSSVGYDKKYHLPVFSISDLPCGEHEIRIVVSGKKASDASDYYIVLDYLRVLGRTHTEPVRLMLNAEYAFPHISWGNYRKPPINLSAGSTQEVRMRIADTGSEGVRECIERGITKWTI